MGTNFTDKIGRVANSAYFPHKSPVSFPLIIEYRSLTAKVYAKDARGYYRAVWQCAGKQKGAQSKRLSVVKAKALAALKQIAKGQTNQPTQHELNELRIAQTALQGTGVGLVDAINEYRQAKQSMPHGTLMEAAKAWTENHADIKPISFKDASAEFIRFRNNRVSERMAYEDALTMDRFCDAFAVDVLDLTKAAIEAFFDGQAKLRPKTRNHRRQTLAQFLAWCVTQDYLSPKHRLGEVLGREAVVDPPPKILTPTQFEKLLNAAPTELLPIIALGGFTGARRSEILRLHWRHVWSVEGHIELEAHLTKTKQRRLIKMQPALNKWLQPWRHKNGAIWEGTAGQFDHVFRKLMADNNLHGKNLLRHSYASYRLAETQNAPRTALEMGHDVAKLFSSYRELVTPKSAKKWFSITPDEPANIIAADVG
ncbi:MAG: tyrosine-type recombinase/integrase [Verrucomicrobia subdivision 3 bacterium]|nr:tyrosine-type recombinase/integrase [Limisphaerales bacterium]